MLIEIHEKVLTVRSLCAIGLVLCLGCGSGGPPTYLVTGAVSYKGKTIPTGSVTFAPVRGGKLVVTAIQEDGTYQLNAPAGDYEVAVAAIAEVAEGIEGFQQKTPRPLLPERFTFPSRSGIVVSVQELETNKVDLSLK